MVTNYEMIWSLELNSLPYDIKITKSLNYKKPVHVQLVIPYPYSAFQKQSVHIPFYAPRFIHIPVPVPVPVLHFQIIPVLRNIYAPKNQFLPVLRTFYVPVPRYGCVDGYGIRTRTPGYGSVFVVTVWLI